MNRLKSTVAIGVTTSINKYGRSGGCWRGADVQEPKNAFNQYIAAVKEGINVVRHLPQELVEVCSLNLL